MKKTILMALALALSSNLALAQSMQVTAKLIPGGIELDGGNGPKQFFCEKDKMVGKIKQGTRTFNMTGHYLSIDFGEHLSFEAYDKPRQTLAPDEVRLTCTKGEITVKVGSNIDIQDQED